ncbi:MAG: hypothetical protein ABIN66_06370 [candidate division WOR-3 bacterium]
MFLFILLGNPLPPPIPINEFAVAPDSLERIELYNPTSRQIDLSGYSLWIWGHDFDTTLYVQEGVVIPPGGLVVLDESNLTGHPYLNDSAGGIHLTPPDTNVYTYFVVYYSPDWAYCHIPSSYPPPEGQSACAVFGESDWFISSYYLDTTPSFGQANDDLGKNTISGFVRNGVTGEPIGGAEVHVHLLYSPCFSEQLDYYDTTDLDGTYYIELPMGRNRLEVRVNATGYYQYFHPETLLLPYNFYDLSLEIYLEPIVGQDEVISSGVFLKIYPNPSPGILKISWSKGPQDVFIYDVLGREIKALPGELGYAEINLPPGVYLVSRGKERIRAIVKSNRR